MIPTSIKSVPEHDKFKCLKSYFFIIYNNKAIGLKIKINSNPAIKSSNFVLFNNYFKLNSFFLWQEKQVDLFFIHN